VIEWGSAEMALPGQAVSGDRPVVAPFPDGVLVAVVDGLGHGTEAAAAAEAAVRTLAAHAAEPVIPLIRRCHQALARTRGVVMSLASFDARASTMTWAAVGNVAAMLIRADPAAKPRREVVSMRGGVVGSGLPPLRAFVLQVAPGDVLVLATDGIGDRFVEEPVLTEPPQHTADLILERHGKNTDDALVLVARYLGGGP
jgi:serine phosphatase RsbU (regulator of sigma subunit)